MPVLLACHDEAQNPHVYATPAPKAAPAAGTAAIAATPELPLGAMGPGAQITSVLDAATGAPVSLTEARGTIDVMSLVALGPDWRGTDVRMDLVLRGTRDTTLVRDLGTPPPIIVAHAFRVSVDALGTGRYSMRVRLLRSGSQVVVESTPVFLIVPE